MNVNTRAPARFDARAAVVRGPYPPLHLMDEWGLELAKFCHAIWIRDGAAARSRGAVHEKIRDIDQRVRWLEEDVAINRVAIAKTRETLAGIDRIVSRMRSTLDQCGDDLQALGLSSHFDRKAVR